MIVFLVLFGLYLKKEHQHENIENNNKLENKIKLTNNCKCGDTLLILHSFKTQIGCNGINMFQVYWSLSDKRNFGNLITTHNYFIEMRSL